MKKVSFKQGVSLIWHGLTSVLTAIANWFTTLLGMNDESKYCKVLRRIVGTCFTFLMILAAVIAGWDFCRTAANRLNIRSYSVDDYFKWIYLSSTATYYYNGYDGFVKNAADEITLTGVKWAVRPLGDDSLVCYSDGRKRGYFSKFTGKPVIKPKYNHAWMFSEGLAAVDDGGSIKFIDSTGKVVIDPKIPYVANAEDYVFHNNYCVVCNGEYYGLLDKQGKWALEPKYYEIKPAVGLWVVKTEEGTSVLDGALDTVIPFTEGSFWVYSDYISVTLLDHTIKRYDRSGALINDFYISNIYYMTYETDEMRYFTVKTYNEDGSVASESDDTTPRPVENMAKCRCYEAEQGWHGLISADGKVITPPSYRSITAIGYDLYLCIDSGDEGIVLNGKGEVVR